MGRIAKRVPMDFDAPVVAAPTRTTLYYGDDSELLTGLDLAVAEGRISVRAARRLGWAS